MKIIALLSLVGALLFWGVLGSSGSVYAQSGTDQSTTADEVKKEFKEAFDKGAEYTYEQKEEYKDYIGEKIDWLDRKIADLKVRAKEESADAKEDINQAIKALEEKRAAAKDKFDKIGDATADAWEDVKQGVGDAFHELGDAFSDAYSRFKKDNS